MELPDLHLAQLFNCAHLNSFSTYKGVQENVEYFKLLKEIDLIMMQILPVVLYLYLLTMVLET